MDDHQSKITPRNRKDKSKVEVTPRSAKTSTTKTKKGTAAGSLKKKSGVASPKTTMMDREGERNKKSVGTDGPGGRERKKQVKVGDKERKRARDEKLGFNGGDGFDAVSRRRLVLRPITDTSRQRGEEDRRSCSPPTRKALMATTNQTTTRHSHLRSNLTLMEPSMVLPKPQRCTKTRSKMSRWMAYLRRLLDRRLRIWHTVEEELKRKWRDRSCLVFGRTTRMRMKR